MFCISWRVGRNSCFAMRHLATRSISACWYIPSHCSAGSSNDHPYVQRSWCAGTGAGGSWLAILPAYGGRSGRISVIHTFITCRPHYKSALNFVKSDGDIVALSHTIPTCQTLDAEVCLPGPVVIGGGLAHGCIHAGIQGCKKPCAWFSEASCSLGIMSQSLPNCSYHQAYQ